MTGLSTNHELSIRDERGYRARAVADSQASELFPEFLPAASDRPKNKTEASLPPFLCRDPLEA
jgi:hypothetical protein